MPVGTVWAAGTWADAAWAADTWADAGDTPAEAAGSQVVADFGLVAAVAARAGLRSPGGNMSRGVTEEFIPIGADALLYYEGAETEAAGTGLTAGTVTYVLKDSAGATVTSGSYTHLSDGDYYATIDRAVTALLTPDDLYTLEVTYADAAGNDDFRRIPLYARYRTNR